jgi:hypothetical protein
VRHQAGALPRRLAAARSADACPCGAQGYTQFGGLRPFGVSFLFAGWDAVHGFQLYQSDPSGNYGGWKATSIGAQRGRRLRGALRVSHI